MNPLLLATVDPAAANSWLEFFNKAGAGAALICGVFCWLLWNAREKEKEKHEAGMKLKDEEWQKIVDRKDQQIHDEVAYGKTRDKETLLVMTELMTLTKAIDTRDKDGVGALQQNHKEVVAAISNVGALVGGVRQLIREHLLALGKPIHERDQSAA